MMRNPTALMALLIGLGHAAATADNNLPTPPAHANPLGGAHGGPDPHARLSADQHIKVALQHLAENRPAEARQVMHQALRSFPQHARARAVYSNMLLDKGDLTGALAHIERAVQLSPATPEFLVGRASLYLAFQRMQEARADLDRALSLDPDFIAARFNRGSILAENGDYETALRDFDHLVAYDPHLPAPYFNRGSIQYALGNRDAAIADIQRFLELAESESWVNAARALLKKWAADAPESSL